MGGTKQSLGLMRPGTTTEQKTDEPGKSLGGAMMAGGGGAVAGASVGGPAGPWSAGAGAAGGFVVGFASYLMS